MQDAVVKRVCLPQGLSLLHTPVVLLKHLLPVVLLNVHSPRVRHMHLPIILHDVQPLKCLNQRRVSSRLLLASVLSKRGNEVINAVSTLPAAAMFSREIPAMSARMAAACELTPRPELL